MRHMQSVKKRGRRLLPSTAGRDGGGDCAGRAAPWAAAESAELSANQRSEFIFLERKGERERDSGGGGEEARAGNHRGVAGSERMGGTAAAGCLVSLLALERAIMGTIITKVRLIDERLCEVCAFKLIVFYTSSNNAI